jgi:hypothetical protein
MVGGTCRMLMVSAKFNWNLFGKLQKDNVGTQGMIILKII